MSTPPDDLIELGVLRGSYGLTGWVHIQPHTGDAGTLRRVRSWWLLPPAAASLPQDSSRRPAQPGGVVTPSPTSPRGPYAVSGVRLHGSHLVAKWEGCDAPESAQAFRSWRVAVSRSQFPRLPDGEHYWIDLVGMQVVNRQGQELGQVSEVRSNGAHDILEVRLAGDDRITLIPQVPAYVDAIDPQTRRISVDWHSDW